MKNRVAILAGVIAAFAFQPAAADDLTPKTRNQFAPEANSSTQAASGGGKVKDLLAAGFEIKSVSIVPRDIVKGGGSTIDVDAVIILLQNREQLASCYVTYESFVTGTYFNGSVPSCRVLK